jgi:carbon storage regulator
MLILSRKCEQEIIIDDNINIKVVEIGRDYVRLGITAPKEIPIYREELIRRANFKPNGQPQGT